MNIKKAKTLLRNILNELEIGKSYFEFLSEGIGENDDRLNDHYEMTSTIADKFYAQFNSVPFDLKDKDSDDYDHAVGLIDSILYEMHLESELRRMQSFEDEHNALLNQIS